MKQFIQSLYLNNRLFLLLGINSALFILGFLIPAVLPVAKVSLLMISVFTCLDIFLLYREKEGLLANRETPEKFSNGDQNPVRISIENFYNFPVKLIIIDEVPVQFQMRDLQFERRLDKGGKDELTYLLRPVSRGEYKFGALNIYASGILGLIRKRYQFALEETVPVYPSYIQMRKYQLMAISNRLTEMGVKKIRRLGHTTEFEQIKEYIRGDDYRTVNWKATARSGKLMVNQYIDERAQNVYCLVDKSRVMKMPFKGMTLLDYAINAALVLSNIAIYRQDKGGLITFAEKINSSVPASSKATQMSLIMEVLYNQSTRFLEADYSRLYTFIKRKIAHRSLLILFTNFESVSAMRRQLPYLLKLSQHHLLVVIFFENTELSDLLEDTPKKLEDIYIKTIGENFAFEKKQIVRELEQQGIISILTPPENLTVNTVNKYLELKSRGMI
ncbi:MAG: DUF58 domain-containing protein [Bacteroidia bacterium]|nr:DUF58 domain-containing protein [Bacteroidia bacterium]